MVGHGSKEKGTSQRPMEAVSFKSQLEVAQPHGHSLSCPGGVDTAETDAVQHLSHRANSQGLIPCLPSCLPPNYNLGSFADFTYRE